MILRRLLEPGLMKRKPGYAAVVLAVLTVLIILTLALPISAWRTGQGDIESLTLGPSADQIMHGQRVWIDTDAACGTSPTTDPDDCLALLALLKAKDIRVVEISSVFGNASIEITDRLTRELAHRLAAEGNTVPAVYLGRGYAIDGVHATATPAEDAMRGALAKGPLVIIALGPLSNIAEVLRDPALRPQVERIVVVMGQRRGHVFHPVEGGTAPRLFGHGPVFSDFNFANDTQATAAVLSFNLPMTLILYEAAREVSITDADLKAMSLGGTTARWVAERSTGWLAYWREEIGQQGFFPFDLVAASYVLHPELFRCAPVRAWIEPHSWRWRWRLGKESLFVGALKADKQVGMGQKLIYCQKLNASAHDEILADIGAQNMRPGR